MRPPPGERQRHEREWCDTCHKQVFNSKREASEMLNSLKSNTYRGGRSVRRTSNRAIPKRAYECPTGNGWHVTRRKRDTGR